MPIKLVYSIDAQGGTMPTSEDRAPATKDQASDRLLDQAEEGGRDASTREATEAEAHAAPGYSWECIMAEIR